MNTNKQEKFAYIVSIALAVFFAGWWVFNALHGHVGDRSHELYSDTYWIVALVGVFYGFHASRQWGGRKSVFGKALLLFSLGLLAQVFGQVIYSYFALVKDIEAPYPSVGDIGYFGSVILYIFAVLTLSKALGVKFSRASNYQKIIAVAAPIILLAATYYLFLSDYKYTGNAVTTFLDFGYPLGQATYISIALFAYILSTKMLGGRMKNKILLLLFALFIQFLADFTFLYRVSQQQWYAGDGSDLTYQLGYLLMTIALISIGGVAYKLRAGKK